jgi:hypothetical protein
LALREVDAGDACAVGDGKRYFDSVAQGDGVVAGVRFFMRVIEGLGVAFERGCRRCGQLTCDWQDRDVAVERASGAAEMRHAEAIDLVLVVEVPAVIAGVGTPLHHAEGERRAGEGVAIARSSNDGIDGVVGALGVGSSGEGDEEEGGNLVQPGHDIS